MCLLSLSHRMIIAVRKIRLNLLKLIGYWDSFISFLLQNLTSMHLAVKGFRLEKGMKRSAGSKSTASIAALSAPLFPWIPTCPETHQNNNKNTSFLSTSILCNICWICTSRRWSVLNFPSVCKAERESKKINHEFTFLRLICLFENKKSACSSTV